MSYYSLSWNDDGSLDHEVSVKHRECDEVPAFFIANDAGAHRILFARHASGLYLYLFLLFGDRIKIFRLILLAVPAKSGTEKTLSEIGDGIIRCPHQVSFAQFSHHVREKSKQLSVGLVREIHAICTQPHLPLRASECTQPCMRDLEFAKTSLLKKSSERT